jgi:hypothetical protein
MKNLFILSLFILSTFASANTYTLNCHSTDAYTDIGYARLQMNSKVTVNSTNDYVLEGGTFKFFIEDAWTDQEVTVATVPNKKDYNPRVYFNHAKFPNISTEFFGMIDFMLPHDALVNGTQRFTGVFVLTWVEDHWGGTITAECSLK